MIRPSTVLWIGAVVVVGYAMFQVKYDVMQQEEQLVRIHRQTAEAREQIRVLDAEWSFLTQPTRLDQLAKRYLSLAPIGTAQLGSIAALPQRPAAEPAAPIAVAAPPPETVAIARTGTRIANLKASVTR